MNFFRSSEKKKSELLLRNFVGVASEISLEVFSRISLGFPRFTIGVSPEISPRFLPTDLSGYYSVYHTEFHAVFLPGFLPQFLPKCLAGFLPEFLSRYLEQFFRDFFRSSSQVSAKVSSRISTGTPPRFLLNDFSEELLVFLPGVLLRSYSLDVFQSLSGDFTELFLWIGR